MNRRIIIPIILSFIIFHFLSGNTRAEVVTQNFTLSPGWNAVFLEVEPQDPDPVVVFAGLTGLDSVWAWNPRTGTVEFIQNPDQMVPEGPQMMVYFPPPDPATPDQPNLLTNLHAIHGERGYLIKMGGNVDVSWTVRGHPAIPDIDWKPNSFNLVGFHLEKGNEPLFDHFFSNSPAHAGQEIYVLRNDAWVRVTDTTVRMKHGEAFWIFCKGSSEFQGPVSVQLDIGTGLPFGTTLDEQEIRIINNSASSKTVTLGISSGTWLYYWVFDPQNNVAEWQLFPPGPMTIPANDSRTLRLAVRRAALTSGASYEANVEFTDGEGVRILLPSSVTGIDFAGLWVGDAMITKVSEPRINNTPVATGSEFSLRLIVHVNNTGQVRLLNEVIQMWQEGTGGQPGKFVLLGDDSLIAGYTGAAMRDGRLVGRRISSAAFPINGAISMVDGSPTPSNGIKFGAGGTLTTTLVLSETDPSNPFLHKYHPDHRVKDKDGNIIAGQSYEVTREITMEFTDTDSQGRPISGVPILSWGSSDVGGIYKETITGLHKPGNPIYIEGTFWLHKVSNVSTLE